MNIQKGPLSFAILRNAYSLYSCYLWFYQHTCPFPSLLFAKWSMKGPSFYPLPSGQTTPPPPGGGQTVCEGEGSALPVIDQHRWTNWHTECFGKGEIRAIFLPGKLLFNYCIFRGFALSRFHFGYSHQRNSVKNKHECPPANKALNTRYTVKYESSSLPIVHDIHIRHQTVPRCSYSNYNATLLYTV